MPQLAHWAAVAFTLAVAMAAAQGAQAAKAMVSGTVPVLAASGAAAWGDTLGATGHSVNASLQVVHAKTGAAFRFLDQAQYNGVSEGVKRWVWSAMAQRGLQRTGIALGTKEPSAYVFASPDLSSFSTVVLLIQGLGAVRPGMWASSVAVNDNITGGSMLPEIDWALDAGAGVVVLNPNQRQVEEADGNTAYAVGTAIPAGASYVEHTVAVWDALLSTTTAKVGIIAHSNGGVCTRGLVEARAGQLLPRLQALAFTDASDLKDPLSPDTAALAEGVPAVNWAASRHALGTELGSSAGGWITHQSAGHTKHVYTTASARPAMLPWLAKHLSLKH